MINSDCRKLSASAPTMRSLTGGCPSGVKAEVVADAEVQHVHQRRLIGDRRDRAIFERSIQEQPRVGELFRRRRHRRGKREARLREEARLRRDDARVGRAIQRQAAGFIAGTQAKTRDRGLRHDRIRRLRVRARRVLPSCSDRASAARPTRPSALKPPVPDRGSLPAAETSFLNAPTLTSTKLANAISARLNTDRAGRTDV